MSQGGFDLGVGNVGEPLVYASGGTDEFPLVVAMPIGGLAFEAAFFAIDDNCSNFVGELEGWKLGGADYVHLAIDLFQGFHGVASEW